MKVFVKIQDVWQCKSFAYIEIEKEIWSLQRRQTQWRSIKGDEWYKIGGITSGIPYQYVKGDSKCVQQTWHGESTSEKLIEEFAWKWDTLHCGRIGSRYWRTGELWGVKARGKKFLQCRGEYKGYYDPWGGFSEKGRCESTAQVPGRTDFMSVDVHTGSVYHVLNSWRSMRQETSVAILWGQLHHLVLWTQIICMGASIVSHGMEKAKGKDYIKRTAYRIGDSTFLHTGVNLLANMMYNKATGTVMILITPQPEWPGHQDHVRRPQTLLGYRRMQSIFWRFCGKLRKTKRSKCAFDIEKLKSGKRRSGKDEVSVIITKSPCVLLDKSKKPVYIAWRQAKMWYVYETDDWHDKKCDETIHYRRYDVNRM